MKRYRDQSVAHHDPRRVEIRTYPTFDIALKSAYWYYEFVVGELRKIGLRQIPNDLEQYGNAFREKCESIATAAMRATKDFPKDVY